MSELARTVDCPSCGKSQKLTLIGKFRNHGPKDNPCEMSGVFAPNPPSLPPEEPCPTTPSQETSPASNDATESVESAISTIRSAFPTMREISTTPTTSESQPNQPDTDTIPGVEEYVEATQTAYLQPASDVGYQRPAKLNRGVTGVKPMDEQGTAITAMLKEMFYQYTNRSRRSQQKTLGPSQIGSPCDRRLVMHLLGAPPVNPGGDNWASFVGTCIHSGLEKMLTWADAGQGRFVTEMPLKFPNSTVPRGTLDLLDRVLVMVDDHKAMGQWSLDKLKTNGPSPVYRVQLHVYAMGARIRGEKVEHVALIGWPRDKANLDDLYVWHEPYDPSVAREAFARVDQLQAWITELRNSSATPRQVAEAASIEDDCRFCPYHQPDAKDLEFGGCNGRA